MGNTAVVVPIRTLLVSSRPLVRSLLADTLRTRCDAVVTAEFSTAGELREKVGVHSEIQLLVIDFSPADRATFDAVDAIHRDQPAWRILFLTSACGDYVPHRASLCGATGIVHECDQPETLAAAVAAVVAGGLFHSPEVLRRRALFPLVSQVTAKELAVLELASAAIGDEEAAKALGCGSATVETHRRNLMAKLSLSDWTEVILYGIRLGMVAAAQIPLTNRRRRTALRRKMP